MRLYKFVFCLFFALSAPFVKSESAQGSGKLDLPMLSLVQSEINGYIVTVLSGLNKFKVFNIESSTIPTVFDLNKKALVPKEQYLLQKTSNETTQRLVRSDQTQISREEAFLVFVPQKPTAKPVKQLPFDFEKHRKYLLGRTTTHGVPNAKPSVEFVAGFDSDEDQSVDLLLVNAGSKQFELNGFLLYIDKNGKWFIVTATGL